MPSYTYRRTASDLSGLNDTVKSPTDGVGSDSRSRKLLVYASEVDARMSTKPTLDDFGGRSDALGG
jgi:hypothetical protein